MNACNACGGPLVEEYEKVLVDDLSKLSSSSMIRRVQSGMCWVCSRLQKAVIRDSNVPISED